MSLDLVVRARRAITPDGEVACDIGVRGGVIAEVGPGLTAGRVVELADDEVLLPGLVDTHVHVNEPGRTEWEGFASATRAAAAGGITTIVDMPLNSIPPTVDLAALDAKRKAAAGACHVDVGFWGGAVPGNLGALRALHEAGVLGFKCFLAPSGVQEFGHLSRSGLEQVMREIAAFDGLLLVHAENAGELSEAPPSRSYGTFLTSRPARAEIASIAAVADASRATGCRVHVVHLSSAGALPVLARTRGEGVPVSVETCPHYLVFAAEDIRDGATQFKCCPPIRGAADQEALWDGLRDGVIDMVVSDHSPSVAALKRLDSGDFGAAWGGIASVQLGLPAVWTRARERGFGLSDVVHWMATATARQIGLDDRGAIEAGRAADFCVFAPDDTWSVDAARLRHKNAITPYDGMTLSGVVRGTWLRGEPIDLSGPPRGRLLSGGAR